MMTLERFIVNRSVNIYGTLNIDGHIFYTSENVDRKNLIKLQEGRYKLYPTFCQQIIYQLHDIHIVRREANNNNVITKNVSLFSFSNVGMQNNIYIGSAINKKEKKHVTEIENTKKKIQALFKKNPQTFIVIKNKIKKQKY